MKNKTTPYIVFSVLLFIANLAALAFMFSTAKEEGPTNVKRPDVDPPPFLLSKTDAPVSDGDIAVPAVSESDVPEVVMVSLSDTPTAASIDAIAEEYHCNALTVAVIKDGDVAYNYEIGFADKKKKRSLNSDTKFRIASLSKVYTSMLGMNLVEDGIVDLDGDVSDVFGYTVRNPYFNKEPITLRMLLTHTSSFRDRSKYIFSSDIRFDIQDRESHFNSKPGSRFVYSNLGMGIAGAMIEQASGMQLTEYSNQAFFDGMDIDAVFNGALLKERENVADCLSGFSLERSAEKLLEPHGDKDPGKNHTVAAGGLIISAVDYAKILTLFINDGSYKGVSYLTPETIAAMHETQIETNDFDQCIGIRRSEKVLEGRTVYYHTGAAYGIFSLAIYDVSDKSGVVVFTSGSADRANDIGIRRSCIETAEVIYRDIIDGGTQTTSFSDD